MLRYTLNALRPAVAAGLLLAATLGAAAPAAAQEVTLRLHHYVPPVSFPHTRFVMPWAEKVERESGGRIKVIVHPGMQLGGTQAQLIDQVRDGVVDIVWTMPGVTAGRFPKTEIFELPFVHTHAMASTMALQDYYDKHLRDEYKDVHVLLLHTNDGLLVHANKPIRRIEDYAGLRLRTPNRAGSVFLRAVGATPVGAPITEVPQMMAKGTIDGTLISYEIALPLKLHEMARNHSDFAGPQPRVQAPVFLFAMNRQRYEQLPDDLKRVIDANSGRALAPVAARTWAAVEKIGEDAARAQGNTFATMPIEEVDRVKAALAPEVARTLRELSGRGIDAQALYDDAREMVRRQAERP
jgi:TRAP-type C4-dicarboxylate transport system substrate-binding protein